MQKNTITATLTLLLAALALGACSKAVATGLDSTAIAKAADTQTTVTDDVVRIGWSRVDVAVEVDGMALPPAAGLGSWAVFKPTGKDQEAIVMGDTVVFQDEIDVAMDAAFAHGLSVTALHNHFFYDEPKVCFMHIGGHGFAVELATAVKAVWGAIKEVRAANAEPATRFTGTPAKSGGKIDAQRIRDITGLDPTIHSGGVVKISSGRTASMHATEVGGSMGLTSWAAFTGNDTLAAIDGDFIMTGAEVQPVLQALRTAGLHVVALHNHMIGEQPAYYFTHFWGKGPVAELAKGFKAALKAQEEVQQRN